MGDVLHAMPAVAALRELHPDWVIGWAIEPGWRELCCETDSDGVRGHLSAMRGDAAGGSVDLSVLRRGSGSGGRFRWRRCGRFRTLRRELRGEQFDLCVDMQGSIRSAVVGRMAGARAFCGAGGAAGGVRRHGCTGERCGSSATHVVEQGCELLGAAVGETLRPAKVTLPVDAAAERWCDAAAGWLVAERFVLIAPTAGWGAKQWPAERYGAVAAALGRAGFRTLVNAASTEDAVAQACGRGERWMRRRWFPALSGR